MTDLLTLSDGHLIGLAGIPAFKSGLEDFQAGAVVECTHNNGHVSGIVSDDKLHAVKLRHTAKHLEGLCDCPESSDTDFCKHSIALTMHYRQELAEHHSLASGDVLDRIKAYINSMSKTDLKEALHEIIEDDPSLHNRWSVRADLALNKVDSKLIRKRITAAFPYNKRLYRRRQVREYFYKAGVEIELLEKQLPKLDANKALRLLDYAFHRLQRALETLDDSHSHRSNLLAALQRLHIETLGRCDWKINRIVRYLEDLEISVAHDFYPPIPSDYDSALGPEGQRLYLSRKQDQWDALPPLSFGADWEQTHHYVKIQAHLLEEARRKHDADSEISLLEKTCIDPKACLSLCKRLLELGKWKKLEYWLGEARKWERYSGTVGHLPNLDLNRLTTEVLMQKGQTNDALDLQWEVYQQSHIIEDYKQLIRQADLAGSTEVWKARVFRMLHKMIEDPSPGHFVQRTLNHLVELYLLERHPEAALELVNYHSLSYQALALLIKAFSSEPDIIYPLYQQQLSLLLGQANNHAYQEAVDLLMHCKNTLKTCDEHHFSGMLEAVRHDYRKITAFQELLDQALK